MVLGEFSSSTLSSFFVLCSRLQPSRYTAHLTDPISCCFTDWVGNGVGLKDANHPLFKDCFRDFLVKLDDLQGNDEDVSRHGSSLELSRPPPVQFGFSITRSSSDLKGVDEAQPEAK